jgi:hypothetical protein
MDKIDKNALFLNQVKNKRKMITINDNEVVIIKKDISILLETEFKKIEVIPFVDNMEGFVIIYMGKQFFVQVNNFTLHINAHFKKLHQYFESVLIENILENIHKINE